ncbi:hypothetical protein KAI92_00005 [Candidatus Parcubacteria bacterium]|nr:hypothetical protein [Candidatus Parcubacteria bacterium]
MKKLFIKNNINKILFFCLFLVPFFIILVFSKNVFAEDIEQKNEKDTKSTGRILLEIDERELYNCIFDKEYSRDLCYYFVAKKYKKLEYCDKIFDKTINDECCFVVAVGVNEKEICDQISNAGLRGGCIKAITGKLPTKQRMALFANYFVSFLALVLFELLFFSVLLRKDKIRYKVKKIFLIGAIDVFVVMHYVNLIKYFESIFSVFSDVFILWFIIYPLPAIFSIIIFRLFGGLVFIASNNYILKLKQNDAIKFYLLLSIVNVLVVYIFYISLLVGWLMWIDG